MAKPTANFECTLSELYSGKGTDTSVSSEFKLKKIDVLVLEMEDVLFHLDSAVMMPDRPAGKSSADGTEDDATDADEAEIQEDQDKVSGLRALALGLKQFKFEPDKRLLLAGHTDTSGDPKMNFELSDQRARGVLYLLEGNREEWAKVSEKRHRIEDYQQIMTYMKDNKGWVDCDPGAINNSWNQKTSDATEKFIKRYNDWVLSGLAPAGSLPIPEETHKKIKNDGAHKWTLEMWLAVFDLYNEEIAGALRVDRDRLDSEYRSLLKFVDSSNNEKKYIACGESYPIDDAEKSNYRSQVNRRVELFFFNLKEDPKLDCPARVTTVHEAPECPMWHKLQFKRTYIDGADLTARAYHLKFVYYNRIHDDWKEVPKGLQIEAFKDLVENSANNLHARVTFSKGIYIAKVEDNPPPAHIHFTFKTVDPSDTSPKWIYTADKSSAPVIKSEKEIETELASKFGKATQIKDLPPAERAKYYDLPQRWRSQKWPAKVSSAWKTSEEAIKPETSFDKPIEFYLDTTVLTDQGLTMIEWNENNRFAIFDLKLGIKSPDPDKPYLSKGTLKRNFFSPEITIKPPRLIYCNGQFYDATWKRVGGGDMLGARAAVLNDPEVHFAESIKQPLHTVCGNYDIHFLTHCLSPDGDPWAYVLVYWSARFVKKADVTDDDVKKFHKQGFTESAWRWRKKQTRLKPRSDPSGKNMVVGFAFYYEGREQSPYKCTVNLHSVASKQRANMGVDEGNLVVDQYTPSGDAYSEDGENYDWYTMAHEIGHAMGLLDEYREPIEGGNFKGAPLPEFDQWYPGMPYGFEDPSMMVRNHAPRLRHYWHYCRWVNDTAGVKQLTGNSLFHVEDGLGKNLKYFLEEKYKDFYKYVAEQEDVKNADYGILDLFLYKVGEDESTKRMIPGQSGFDGILVVRSKLQFFFDDHDGSSWTDDKERLNHMGLFQLTVNDRLNGTFYITSSGDPDFKKIYVQFVPHYYFKGSTISDHFEIEVKANKNPGVKYQPDFFQDGFDSDEFSVDANQNTVSIVRYVLGLKPYKVVPVTGGGTKKESITTITAADLSFLAQWVAKKRGGGHVYEVKT